MSSSARQLDELAARPRVPGATYRFQFNREFTFSQASAWVSYLRDLGVTDCYASPLFQAGPESTHGYDVCSFELFNSRLGGRPEFEHFSARLRQAGLGLLFDMVPNHMGADLSNGWWADVLTHGRASAFAPFFDIEWAPPDPALHNKVLIPILEDHYADVIESGKLQLVYEDGRFALAYHDRRFPVAPGSDPALENLDPKGAQAACRQYQGQPGQPRSFDRLAALVRQQHYRLAFWRVGAEVINYRRFFDVTQLVSVRMELPLVFEACHRLVFELLQSGQVTGLRIDHPDGLWDPQEYFKRLQAGFALGQPRPTGPLYVVAEKILSADETLRQDWPIAGTTGYDFLNQVNGLFVDSAHAAAFDALYGGFTGRTGDFSEAVYEGKKHVLEVSLASELTLLTHRLRAVAAKTRYGQDFTFRELRRALIEIAAAFQVYRTYITAESEQVTPSERGYVEEAVAQAKVRLPASEAPVLNFMQNLLLLRLPADFTEEARQLSREFVLRFQQLTGPVTAKGIEDTAFYRHNRLVSLNEVGGTPGRFGVSMAEFHAFNLGQAERWPHTLLATATHDTKRGEDVRARLNVLSEIPGEWESAVRCWAQLNAQWKTVVHSEPAPDANDEYLLYQTLVGAWPVGATAEAAFTDRLVAYMRKALREAKTHTNWTDPDSEYEEATQRFTEDILDPLKSSAFLETFLPFQRRIAFFGQVNSLAQLLLKSTCPGVPDFYQGTELWDLNLVDPDNRRPVDFNLRSQFLKQLRKQAGVPGARRELIRELWSTRTTGQIKLFVTWLALSLRRRLAALFADGSYVSLECSGAKAAHVCAFARVHEKQVTVTIVPRLVVGLTGGREQLPVGSEIWQDTCLDLRSADLQGTYHNVLTNESLATRGPHIPIRSALGEFPVALLERTG